MNASKPACGHFVLKPECQVCDAFKKRWYRKLQAHDKSWKDIEYGQECPERLYDPAGSKDLDPLTTDFYDRVLDIFHAWERDQRSKRDLIVAELYGQGKTVRQIASALKSERLKPRSIGAIYQTIKEIKAIVIKTEHRHLSVEQVTTLHLLDSKPNKDEADGQKDPSPDAGEKRRHPRAA